MKIIIDGEDKKYFIKKPKGWSPCILGNKKHRDPELNTLPNCVSWSTGRFNMLGLIGSCKYLGNTNAENFTKFCKSQGLELGNDPKVGACMCWEGKGELAGHVAIVEEVVNGNKVITSESGWTASKSYWTSSRTRDKNNWQGGSKLKFKGFIYNPCVEDYWTKGTYRILKEKYIRKTPKVDNNYVYVYQCASNVKSKLTSNKPKDKAKFRKGVEVNFSGTFKYDSKGNMWALMSNCWICCKDSTGNQVIKVK